MVYVLTLVFADHGLLTVGTTVDEACYLYTLMERSCEVQLLVEAAAANGIPKVYVPEESARYSKFEGFTKPCFRRMLILSSCLGSL